MSYPAPLVLLICLLAVRCESIQHRGGQGMIELYHSKSARHKRAKRQSTVEITTTHLCLWVDARAIP